MDTQTALTVAMHKIRNQISQDQLADAASIGSNRMRKIRSGEQEIYATEIKSLIELIHSVDPSAALVIAQSLVPSSEFSVELANAQPDALHLEVLQTSALSGDISRDLASAAEDGRIDEAELERFEMHAASLKQQGADLSAVVETMRKKNSRAEQA